MSNNTTYSHIQTETMSLALDGLLDPQEQQRFDVHLHRCPACRMRWSKWACISNLLQAEPFVGPRPGFILRVDQRIQARQKRREKLLGGLVLAGGAMSIWTLLFTGLILVTAVWLMTNPGVRFHGIDFVVYAGQLVLLALNSLVAVRENLFTILPAPALALILGVIMMVAAVIWARLIPNAHQTAIRLDARSK